MPDNGVLGACIFLIVVQVLRKYMTIGRLEPYGRASHKSLEGGTFRFIVQSLYRFCGLGFGGLGLRVGCGLGFRVYRI